MQGCGISPRNEGDFCDALRKVDGFHRSCCEERRRVCYESGILHEKLAPMYYSRVYLRLELIERVLMVMGSQLKGHGMQVGMVGNERVCTLST